ncbi:MAG: chitinase, partial [Xanthomonadaceae bacterium]|nr:chitinase [Xanthomonadaceae bacterium]
MLRQALTALALLVAGIDPTVACAASTSTAKVIGAYYPGGSATRYPVAQIPADRLTHLFYAFARIE